MNEKKLVTWEMFKKYHEHLVGYIGENDGLTLDDEETCHMTSEEEVEENES